MTMGERIRQARVEAGLSQRQLAGEMMTRNLLSALEHDGANPSVNTLKYLSEMLCKPIGYFLGEDIPEAPGVREMEQARRCFSNGEYETCLKEVKSIQAPTFQPEMALLEVLCLLEMAKSARMDGKLPYCRELLRECENAMEQCPYMKEEIRKKWLMESALAAIGTERAKFAAQLPPEDGAMLLRAEGALQDGAYHKAVTLLDAVEDQQSVQWNMLRGELYFVQKDYGKAAQCYHRAEGEMPEKTVKRLEICYREMGDYKMAYYYAKKEK